ncbi:hypothetical protein KIH74_33885 [Kineosporia sp. J2-2]|uniref:Uncharacterized protein n=1 Tax=Kineosporia corallincola TaxID=2835133 RepID=A0ABS5TT70_9ACTN|nr:hypothetical protein [Kineosporia corallincola]MBT0773985.1 hypothetical protein [Kineosporia corallincola]
MIQEDPDIEIFLEYSAGMMHIEALRANWEQDFVDAVANLRVEWIKEGFRRGFAKSLAGQLASRVYERETGWDFDTTEEFHEHLMGLWTKFYGDADPAESLN